MLANQMLGVRAELPASETTAHAIILPFEFDWSSLDSKAQAGFEYLYEALRRHFLVPALQTDSAEDFAQLWELARLRVLDIAQCLSALIFEATSGVGNRAVVEAQLVKSDRRAADDLADKSEHAGRLDTATRLRAANVLISRARACVTEQLAEATEILLEPFESFRRGNHLWFVGISLLDECVSEWLPQHEPREGLLDDCLGIVEVGGVVAGLAALDLCEVEFVPLDDEEWLSSLLEPAESISFLLEALRRTREYFGPKTTVSLVQFVEPDSDGPISTLFSIESDLEPERKCDQFERFCEQWWYEAVEAAGVVIHPVLDVAR